jgi:tRNA/rRNA methyltransferase
MTTAVKLENFAIVLKRPRFPENIGSAARAMCNMGFSRLIVVNPENPDLEKINRLATHAARNVVDNLVIQQNLKSALASFQHVVGTTARLGGQRKVIGSPAQMAADLVALSCNNHIAILFGPEDRGLSNEDLRLCHSLVNIPTADFSSLNLAQAVMVICYAVFSADLPERKHVPPRLASRHELDGMYDKIKEILIKIDYLQPQNPDYWMNKLRHFFTRMELRAGEVSIIRGICRQFEWYAGKCYQDGYRDRRREEKRSQ